jgi:hypothetical protein
MATFISRITLSLRIAVYGKNYTEVNRTSENQNTGGERILDIRNFERERTLEIQSTEQEQISEFQKTERERQLEPDDLTIRLSRPSYESSGLFIDTSHLDMPHLLGSVGMLW